MPRKPPRIRSLERCLLALPEEGEPMLVTELDGFMAGLLVCPDLVMPRQWLPMVWSRSGNEDDAPVFDDMADVQTLVGAVMEHYNAVANALSNGAMGYAPILEDDPRTNEILWELWAGGFGRAVDLRPESWTAVAEDGDEETQAALAGLLELVAIARGDSRLPRKEIDDLTLKAPAMVPKWVKTLNAGRIAQMKGTAAPPATFGKVGRNDPCPCGSGKKYKKCCGLN